jgi:hypothetical protein
MGAAISKLPGMGPVSPKKQRSTAEGVLRGLDPKRYDAEKRKAEDKAAAKKHKSAVQYMKDNPAVFGGMKPHKDTGRAAHAAKRATEKTLKSKLTPAQIIQQYGGIKMPGGSIKRKGRKRPAKKAPTRLPPPRTAKGGGPPATGTGVFHPDVISGRYYAKRRKDPNYGVTKTPKTHRTLLSESYYKTPEPKQKSLRQMMSGPAAAAKNRAAAARAAAERRAATAKRRSRIPRYRYGGAKI